MPHLTRDGVRLAYDITGAGDPTLVFIHGWTCNRTNFADQVAHFAPMHRCVSVDLRGHGESDNPQQPYPIDAFADDVAWMLDQLGIERAVVIGHSMGGAITLALSAQRPKLPLGLVLLDPAIFFPAEIIPSIPMFAAAFGGPEGEQRVREFANQQFFLETSDPSLKVRIVEELAATPLHVTAAAFEGIAAFDAAPAIAATAAPILYVGAEPRITNVDRLRELAPHAQIEYTSGAGHFHQIEAPDQVNAMIERFIAPL
jgi:pimeloyl-ACP methyl ester carboxylesterase